MNNSNCNKWELNGEIITSTERPHPDATPCVNKSRIVGCSYIPYRVGSKAWRNAANAVLADCARYNFERKSSNLPYRY